MFALIPHIVRGPEVNDSEPATDRRGHGERAATTAYRDERNSSGRRSGCWGSTANAGQAAAGSTGNSGCSDARTDADASYCAGSRPRASCSIRARSRRPKGSTFTVNILVSGAQNVYSVPLQLNYDPSKSAVVNVSNGGFLSQDGQTVALVHREDETSGTLQITATRPPNSGGVSGQGSVVTLTFMAKSAASRH